MMSKSFHNLGNAFYKKEDYEKSVAAYKQALKLNPKDVDTKYNLMMAMAKLKNNKGGDGDKNQQKDKQQQDKQDKNQQQNGGDKNQQQKNQQGQQQPQNSPSQPQQQQAQAQQMSNEEAQKLLDAIGSEESKVQQKLSKEKGKPQNGKVQKDW